VDGDLFELDPEVLAKLRGEIERIDRPVRVPDIHPFAQIAVVKRHKARQDAQADLRHAIALWAGHLKARAHSDSEIYRHFYFGFGTDIATAQTLGAGEAADLQERVQKAIDNFRAS
jgi:hypothetical protein